MLRSPLAKLIVSSGSAQALLFIGNIATALLHTPRSIGEYGFYATAASLISIAAAIRLDYFAFFADKAESARTLAPACGVLFLAATTCILLMLATSGALSKEDAAYFFISIFSFTTFNLLSQQTLLHKDYETYSKGRIINGLAFIVLLPATSTLGTPGLLYALCGAQFISSLYLYSKNPFSVQFAHFAPAIKYRIKNRLINLTSTSIQLLSPALPLLVGVYFFSKEELGVFFWLSQIFAGGAAIIKRSLMGFLSAELIHNGKIQAETLNIAHKSLKLGLALSVIFATLAWSAGSFPVDLGPDWSKAIVLVPPLALLYVTDTLLQPLGSLLPSIGKEKFHFTNESLRLLSVSTCFVTANILDSGITGFTWLYASTMTIFYVTGALLFYKFASEEKNAQHKN